jgi:hypothetical protein
MRKFQMSLLAVLWWFAAMGVAHADSMRCGGVIVTPGAKQSEVLELCGEPASKTVEDVAKREGKYYEGTTPVETWTYTSGAVNTVLTFDSGVLLSIQTK